MSVTMYVLISVLSTWTIVGGVLSLLLMRISSPDDFDRPALVFITIVVFGGPITNLVFMGIGIKAIAEIIIAKVIMYRKGLIKWCQNMQEKAEKATRMAGRFRFDVQVERVKHGKMYTKRGIKTLCDQPCEMLKIIYCQATTGEKCPKTIGDQKICGGPRFGDGGCQRYLNVSHTNLYADTIDPKICEICEYRYHKNNVVPNEVDEVDDEEYPEEPGDEEDNE